MDSRIRATREGLGWSQAELAARAGVTRQLVSAVEAGRHTPNVAAAIGMSRALGATVEEVFGPHVTAVESVLGDDLTGPICSARIGDRLVGISMRHGVETSERWAFPDAIVGDDGLSWLPDGQPGEFVIAGCDPVLALLATLVERTSRHRVLTVHASTGRAVAALEAGRVHAVVVHGPAGGLPVPPVPVRRWHLAGWEVGLATRGRTTAPSVDVLAQHRVRVVQRDAGAASQRAFENALRAAGVETSLPGPVADGHVDVARRVHHGEGRVGVTMEGAAHAFGLRFTPLEAHGVELWIDAQWANLGAASALVDALTRASFRRRAGLLRGYDLADCGVEQTPVLSSAT